MKLFYRLTVILSVLFAGGTLDGYGAARAEVAPPFEVKAREVLLMDLSTGATLYEKNADAPMPPASMSKLMTIYVVFDALRNGEFNPNDKFRVSEKAWRKGGSKMFVGLGDEILIRDLLRGVIVQSGNDACIVLAEGIAGSEEYFAQLMNEKAKEIGLTGSVFRNSTGWPDPNHYMTARDLATLAARIIEEYPNFYSYFAETSFTYGVSLDGKPITQPNRNPILGRVTGADGLKTGHTEEAGYGLTASAIRDGRRLVLVVTGLGSERQRAISAERFIEWGFRNFETLAIAKKGEVIEQATVWLGDKAFVPLVAEDDLAITITKRDRRNLQAHVVYNDPIPAPIQTGTPVARLVLSGPDMGERIIPLVAGADIDKVGAFGKIGSALQYLLLGRSGAE